LIASGDVAGAARLAVTSPRGLLRTKETIKLFEDMPDQVDQGKPIVQYVSALLESGKLNAVESVELSRSIIRQGQVPLIETWIAEDKLEHSEQLGDLLAEVDINLSLAVYIRAKIPKKALLCLMEKQEIDKKLRETESQAKETLRSECEALSNGKLSLEVGAELNNHLHCISHHSRCSEHHRTVV
jgi:clathrin heavy chain